MTTIQHDGAERIVAAFERAKGAGRAALIPYITAGDPDLGATKAIVPALVEAGADIVEIGLPYSDPLADGPTIQRSGQRALAAGTTRRGVFDAIAAVREGGVTAPIVLLAYYNCIYRRGEARFMAEAAACGVDGVVTPDLPPEEGATLRTAATKAGVALIPLVAPTSTPERRQRIGSLAQGFIYCVSVTGVTGARTALAETLPDFVEDVRRANGAQVPLAIGFGISDGEQARRAAAYADGVIVGSALVERMEGAGSAEQAAARGAAFIGQLRDALDGTAIAG